jgi:hypothetical protein
VKWENLENRKPQRLSTSARLEMAAPRVAEPRDPSTLPVVIQSGIAAQQERFVDATTAAAFLSITRKYLLKLSRVGLIPAHPFGVGSRKQWRYRISELEGWGLAQNAVPADNEGGSLRAAKKGGRAQRKTSHPPRCSGSRLATALLDCALMFIAGRFRRVRNRP